MDREERFWMEKRQNCHLPDGHNGDSNECSRNSNLHEDNDVPQEYITGIANFCNISFSVNSSVMIPRRGTETVAQRAWELYCSALTQHSTLPPSPPSSYSYTDHQSCEIPTVRILDLGTGSGCILLALLMRIMNTPPQGLEEDLSDHIHNKSIFLQGSGVIISKEALEVARSNANKLGFVETTLSGLPETALSHSSSSSSSSSCIVSTEQHPSNQKECQHQAKVSFSQGTFETPNVTGPFKIIVSNPPYHTKRARNTLHAATLEHEPHSALFVHPHNNNNKDQPQDQRDDALLYYRQIINSIIQNQMLIPESGILVLEVYRCNADSVVKLLQDANFGRVNVSRDDRGCIRTVEGIMGCML